MSIKADTDLLELMLSDYGKVEQIWKATEYWKIIGEPLSECLKIQENIINFRRLPMRTGIASALPTNPWRVPKLEGRGKVASNALKYIPGVGKIINHYERSIYETLKLAESKFLRSLFISYLLIEELSRPRKTLDDKMIGNPDDVINIDAKYFSYRSLGYQHLYHQLGKYLNWDDVHSVLELGSGYGGQAEVALRIRPELKYINVDIPPWLYVAELYLNELFPGQVMGYRETREIDSPVNMLEAMKDRSIAIVPSWKLNYIEGYFDLFWNSKSLQEMNEGSIKNYINYVTKITDKIFLHAYDQPKHNAYNCHYLKDLIKNVSRFKETASEKDLYAGKDSINILLEKPS